MHTVMKVYTVKLMGKGKNIEGAASQFYHRHGSFIIAVSFYHRHLKLT